MPWVYLDDAFYDHPKIIAAGPAAGWLWVVALGWTNRNLTAGVIPKHVARRLVEGGRRLAPLLVKAGLWEDHDDSYRFHDYEQWNKTAAKREQAQKAARARWNHADAHADASADAMPEHVPIASGSNANGHADAMPEQCGEDALRAYAHGEAPKPLALDPKDFEVTSPRQDSSNGRATPKSDDDDRTESNLPSQMPDPTVWEQTGALATLRLARRDLERREAERGPVGDEMNWLRKAAATRADRHSGQLHTLHLEDYIGRVDALVDLLEPEPKPASRGPLANALDATVAAAERIYARNDRPRCETCDGTGWTGDPVTKCPDCQEGL